MTRPTGRSADRRAKDEETRPIPSLPGYSVSASGRVYSDRTDPPLEVYARDTSGGPRIRVSLNGRVKMYYVARLVLEAWIGPAPLGGVAKARDDDRTNVSVDNLYWSETQASVSIEDFVEAYMESTNFIEAA